MKRISRSKYFIIFIIAAVIAAGIIGNKRQSTMTGDETVSKVNVDTKEEADEKEESDKETDTKDSVKELKQVALTFDDGPDPVYTPMILEGLEKRDVKATFFLMGKQVELYPDIVKEMYEKGHQLGNHSYSHRQMTKMSEEEVLNEFDKTNELIEQITGIIPEVFRPPFGSLNDSVESRIDMVEVLWDIDPLDWCTSDTGTVVQRIVSKVDDNQIILMHDSSQTSVNAALQIVDILQKQGYEFVTVEDIIFE